VPITTNEESTLATKFFVMGVELGDNDINYTSSRCGQ
jgi:hypothetical protein